MELYQSSGDLVQVRELAQLYKPDEPQVIHGTLLFTSIVKNDRIKYGMIIERFETPLGIMYQVLVGEEFWLVRAEDINWTGV